jgi:hypothetical protein
MAGATFVAASRELPCTGGKHVPASAAMPGMARTGPPRSADSCGPAGQGSSLLCNGVTEFDDGGELLLDGRAVTPGRRGLSRPAAIAA